MSPRRRRLAFAFVALAVMTTVAAVQRQAEPPAHSFRVLLGLTDNEPTDWNGEIEVADGKATTLSGWRFEGKDAVDGTSKWKCSTRNAVAPGERYPVSKAKGKAPEPPQKPWPNGVHVTVTGNNPAVTLKLAAGEVKFKASD